MKKKLFVIMIAFLLLFTQVYTYGQVVLPDPTTIFYVNDYADIINEDVENNITRINQNYEKTVEKPQIVVATVDSMQGLDENSYATELFDQWDIGDEEYDNGLLVLISLEERRVKIEVGYGLEGAITDADSGRILDSSLEYLSAGNYSDGILNIVVNLASMVNEEYNYDSGDIFGDIDVPAQATDSETGNTLSRILPLIVLFLIFSRFGGGPGGRRRGFFVPLGMNRFGGFGGGGGFSGGGSFGGGGSSGGGGAGRGF
jgi:uncharacterized protein